MRKSLQFGLAAALGAAVVLPAQAEVTVASWGGAYTMSQQKAYSDTFSDLINVQYNKNTLYSANLEFF